MVAAEVVGVPNRLELRCRIIRDGATFFDGSVNTSQIGRTFEALVEHVIRDNHIPDGTVICTGTGVIAQAERALREGDSRRDRADRAAQQPGATRDGPLASATCASSLDAAIIARVNEGP